MEWDSWLTVDSQASAISRKVGLLSVSSARLEWGEEFSVVEYADGDSDTYFFPEFGGVSDVGGGGLERQAFPTSFTPIHEPYFDTTVANN